MARTRESVHSSQNIQAFFNLAFRYSLCWGALSLAPAIFANSAKSEGVLLDRICAVVDSKPILLSRVQEKVSKGPLVVFSDYAPQNSNASSFDSALHDLINELLIKRKMKELDLEVSEAEVNAQIDSILSNNGSTRAELLQYLQANNMTFDAYKEDMRNQMIFMRFKGRMIIPLVRISDSDLEAYFLKTHGRSLDSAQVLVRQIYIPIEKPIFLSEKQKLADDVYEKLKAGLPFEKAQTLYSASSSHEAQSFTLSDLAPNFRNAIKELAAGEFTRPISTGSGFLIFQLEEKKLLGREEFLKSRVQVKKGLENELRANEIKRLTQQWLKTEWERSKIKIIPE